MFHYDRLRNNRALGNGTSDNNNKNNVGSASGPVSLSKILRAEQEKLSRSIKWKCNEGGSQLQLDRPVFDNLVQIKYTR